MKMGKEPLAPIFLAMAILAGAASSAVAELSPLFTLDTRDLDHRLSAVFTLDTRDQDLGAVSELFTLDTRGDTLAQTSVFTLDTRDLELFYAPQNLVLAPAELTVARASWEYNGTPLGFVVDRRLPLGEWNSTAVTGGWVRTWLDTTVLAGQFYEYRVAAVLPTGVSDYSATAYIQMPSLPAAPQAPNAMLTEDGQIAFSWQDASDDEDGFDVWRMDSSAGAWESIAHPGANATGILDSAVSPGTLYTYKVRASNEWGNSGFSAESSVATPASGEGCGFELLAETAAIGLDGIPADTNGLNPADSRALLQGNLSAWIRSPPGNAHPVRVVLGFRDEQGAARGTPVELVNFYRVPGCPGMSVSAEVPEAFRAPESGTNTLWLEMVMAQRDPVEAFITERHTQESPMRKRLLDVAIRSVDPSGTRVRILAGTATPGSLVAVPVELISTGGESQVAFSVAFGSGIEWAGALAGADAPQALLQTVEDVPGAVGVTLLTPAENPLGAGSKRLATLQFLARQAGDYVLHFQDEPLVREIAGGGSGIAWEDGRITVVAAGLEGDVYPCPGGNGVVDDEDVHQALLCALGLAELPADGQEFQRLDCAPIETCGDGRVDIADKVAIQRYAKGQEALKDACGPTNLADAVRLAAAAPRGTAPRSLALDAPAEVSRGDSFQVQVVLDAQGDERALAASLAFDSDVLAYQGLHVLGAATNGVFLPNVESAPEGAIAFGVTLAEADSFAAGDQPIAEITFQALEGSGTIEALLAFADAPAECQLAGTESESLACDYYDATVSLLDSLSSSAAQPPGSGQAVALSTNQIQVSWSPVSWATGYRVRRKLAGETVWTRLADFDESRTVFVDEGLPAGTLCHYLVTSLNPNGDESSFLRLSAQTWTLLDHWRQQWLAQPANSGLAADGADPDGDALPNRMEYQLGTDPLVPDELPYRLAQEEIFPGSRSLTISYAVAQDAPGLVSFEFTENLLGSWSHDGVAPVSLRREGAADQIKLRLPEGAFANQRIFLRMKAE